MRFWIPLALVVLTTPAFADCSAPPDHRIERARLYDLMRSARDESTGRALTNEMWLLWTDAPDATAQALLDHGMLRRAAYDFAGAIADFDKLIDHCPDYAEGYNQRAFVRFLRGDFPDALEDLERAIALDPDHFAAIAGRGLTLIQLGREAVGFASIRQALTYNPWLPERHHLPKAPKPRPETDL